MVRSKVFSFHSVKSVLIAKLKTTNNCKKKKKTKKKRGYGKLDTGSGDNLTPIIINKKLFFYLQVLLS